MSRSGNSLARWQPCPERFHSGCLTRSGASNSPPKAYSPTYFSREGWAFLLAAYAGLIASD